ncbi:DUF2142 domain-containing protein [Gemmiger sp.]|uniref:DUF2142 domain-containing protein n=1 Tax=Gemmiger sp. TaxID=2049027 RepID=UPI002A911109|nr:DUF2142 domain-containing protein [Gemmiger sp.]MDY5605043.1 DUF2142 domain-containing protein [Gemmiger sp.]
MPQTAKKQNHRPLLAALVTLVVLLAATAAIWLAVVRPQLGKGRTETLCDDFNQSELLHPGDSAAQVFTYDKDLYTIGLEFYLPGANPQGTLEVVLSDADTGEELARSTGVMQNIIPDQYTTLGLDTAVAGQPGRRYQLTVTPHYETDAILAVGHSVGVALWKEQMTVNGTPIDGTMAMQVTYQRMGGYLTRFFLLAGGAAALLAAFAVYACLSRKVSLHRLVFVLVLGFGLIYSVTLPPYAAPDEKYHINQSFTLASKWANMLSTDDWQMGKVPTTTTFRRETDTDELLQDENTTVFTWQEFTDTLLTTTDAPFDSHREYHELQTDQNPLLYLASGGAVFLAYLLHLGFTPALALGRLANLLIFALLAAFAVKAAPCGKRIFTAVALLPMTLHLAASFSRDAVLLGLCFAFTALLLDAVYSKLTPKRMAALAVTGILLAPGKMVYLPLAALFVLVPAAALGRHAKAKKLGYLAACLALALVLNTGTLTGALGSPAADNAAAVTEETTDDARSAKNAPAEPDAAYEEAICTDNTMENYVRRLYYYIADTRSPAQSEVDFWVQALAEGDVSPAVLGQSFLFTTDKANTYTDAQAFYTMASYALLGTDVTIGNADAYLPYFAEGGAMQAYKQLFNLPTCVDRFAALGLDVGTMDDRIPLDRETVAAEVEAARATRATQSVTDAADEATYTPGYILHHLPDTALLFVRSIVQNGDHYLRTLVGGSLSYYTLDLAWFWVVALYLLLAYAALPAQNPSLPTGKLRGWGAAAAVCSCLLAVAGCLLWTPTHYETLYGLQGRYFLPVLPALLLTCLPRRLAAVPDDTEAQTHLTGALALVQWGVILNIMLAVIAR